jgi:gliding motility associated protien GldN
MKQFLKSIIMVAFLASMLAVAKAQDRSLSFFTKDGIITTETEHIDGLADTISTVFHRVDDIKWSRVVYRIIDMRDKQNHQMYFPIKPTDYYKNMLRVILDPLITGELTAYPHADFDIKADWTKPIALDSLKDVFVDCMWNTEDNTPINSSLIEVDELTNEPAINNYIYEDYISRQQKFLIMEIVFFNQHYSRLYSKIMSIAPLYFYNETNVTMANTSGFDKSGESYWLSLASSVTCWIKFDDLRPFLAKQYMIPNGNENQRTTFDDFFVQKMYFSYLLGDSNMHNRMLLQSYTNPERIRKEQKRIESEMLNFEQDIWEY